MMAKRKVLSALLGLTLLNGAVAFGFEQKPGFDVRFRYENWDNLITLGTNGASNSFKDRSFFRLRVMLWDEVKFSNQTSLMVRLNTEPKYQMGPYYWSCPRQTGHPSNLFCIILYSLGDLILSPLWG
jgi:hypothetical protein